MPAPAPPPDTDGRAAAWLDRLESLGIQPGLERITALLDRLGNPHRGLPSVVVAGTNGKGSVTAMLSRILMEAGLPAGMYTSPHLETFEERIQVAGAPIDGAEVDRLVPEVAAAAAAMERDGLAPPTYFEATTALAFLHFHRRRVPIAVLEVGMGGRYDATNVVDPIACAITPIALDHTQWLGETLSEIAWQKAGILKPGVPVVVSRQAPEAMAVIRGEAERIGSPLIDATQSEAVANPGLHDPPRFSLRTSGGARYDGLSLSLRGDHQVGNAVTAVLLAEIVRDRGGVDLHAAAVRRGLERTAWPGRLELLASPAGGAAPDLLLDGAHNPDGCSTLAAYLLRHQASRPRRVLLFAAMRDKPAAEMLRILAPVVDATVVTALSLPRGTPPGELARLAAASGRATVCEPDAARALERATALAGTGGLVLVSGSLYLVGAIRKNALTGIPRWSS